MTTVGENAKQVNEGTFKDGELEEGTVTRDDGVITTGTYVNRQQHGHGTITLPNGIKIEGNFVNGQPDDLCSVEYPDKTRYVGSKKGVLPEG